MGGLCPHPKLRQSRNITLAQQEYHCTKCNITLA